MVCSCCLNQYIIRTTCMWNDRILHKYNFFEKHYLRSNSYFFTNKSFISIFLCQMVVWCIQCVIGVGCACPFSLSAITTAMQIPVWESRLASLFPPSIMSLSTTSPIVVGLCRSMDQMGTLLPQAKLERTWWTARKDACARPYQRVGLCPDAHQQIPSYWVKKPPCSHVYKELRKSWYKTILCFQWRLFCQKLRVGKPLQKKPKELKSALQGHRRSLTNHSNMHILYVYISV